MSCRGALEGPERIDGLTAGRVETFSDAVFAIAITLLVLQLRVEDGPGSLADRLGDQWPLYVTYLLSFFNIGTVWLNHHSIFSRLRGVDHGLVLLNLLLLLVVSVLPFPTQVLGDALQEGISTTSAPRRFSTPAIFCAPPPRSVRSGSGPRTTGG